ncbi:MAG TPA: hypothetical protein V6C58_05430 [Allocoleopsis sp.]
MSLEELFQKAKENPRLRQEFIDEIDLGEHNKYISKLKYEGNSKNEIMSCYNFWHGHFGITKTKSKILIYNNAFTHDKIENIHDFLGLLKHHEGFHAMERFEGIFGPNRISIYDIETQIKEDMKIELRTCQNEQKNITEKNSQTYKNWVKDKITAYQKLLN